MSRTFFLAHSNVDLSIVRELRQKLGDAGVSCFLDEVDVPAGQDKATVAREAHPQTAATLVMVSSRYEAVYYLGDEVREALTWAKQGSPHRVVPVFVDGIPSVVPEWIPDGQRLDRVALGTDGLVQRLVALAQTLGAGPTTPLLRPPPPPRDRNKLFQALCKIQQGTNYFGQILMFDLPQAADQVPNTGQATPADRALALVQWASLAEGDAIEQLWQAVLRKAAATLR